MTVRYVTVNGEQLNGDFQLTGKNATLTLNTVAGNVNLENSDDEIELTDIKGGIYFKLRACSLTAKEIGCAIAGTAASGAVVIKDAAGPATLTLENPLPDRTDRRQAHDHQFAQGCLHHRGRGRRDLLQQERLHHPALAAARGQSPCPGDR